MRDKGAAKGRVAVLLRRLLFGDKKPQLLLQVVDGCVAYGLGRVVLSDPFGDLTRCARAAHLRAAHNATQATACDVVADEALGSVGLELIERGRGIRFVKATDGHDGKFACQLVTCGVLRSRGRCCLAVTTGILREQLDQAVVGGRAAEQARPAVRRSCAAVTRDAFAGRIVGRGSAGVVRRSVAAGAATARATAHAAAGSCCDD